MAITTIDQLLAALGNSSQCFIVNKSSISSQVVGGFSSLFRATGVPGQGAIPASASVCDKTLLGAFPFTSPSGGQSSYLAKASMCCGTPASEVQIHDRLAHMGGLNGTLTTPQTVGVNCAVSTSNLSMRIGNSDYSEVQWWLEWYVTTGSTSVTATITYTNGSGVSGKTTSVSIPASTTAGRLLPIISTNGESIQSIQSILLSATTGTSGSFGVTATRFFTSLVLPLSLFTNSFDWAGLGLPKIPDLACLTMIELPGTTNTGALLGNLKLVQG